MEYQGADEKLSEVADVVESPSSSSNGGSQTLTYVGDVDERECAVTEREQQTIKKTEIPTVALQSGEYSDDDSFVVVDVFMEKDVSRYENEQGRRPQSDLNLKALKGEPLVSVTTMGKNDNDNCGNVKDPKLIDSSNQDGGTKSCNQFLPNDGDNGDEDDDLDLDALLDESIDGNTESDRNDSRNKVEESHHEDKITKDPLERNSSDFSKPAVISQDDGDNLDLDALLNDSINGNDNSDKNNENSHHEDTMNAATLERNSSDFAEPSAIFREKEGVELNSLLVNCGADGSPYNDDSETKEGKNTTTWEEDEADEKRKNESSLGFDSSDTSDDKEALELDALLHDSTDDDKEDHHRADFVVIEDKEIEDKKTSLMTSKITKKKATYPSAVGRKIVAKNSNGDVRILPEPKSRIHDEKTNKTTLRKVPVETRQKTPTKKTMEELLNIPPSITHTLSKSKNKIRTARDRMKEYSRVLPIRASNQIRKNNKAAYRGSEERVGSKPRFMPTTSTRLSSIPTSTTSKVRGEIGGEGKGAKTLWGENDNKNDFRHYMKSTVAFTSNVVETQIVKQQKTKLKENNAKKILVDITPWKMRNDPVKAELEHGDIGLNQRTRATPSPRSNDCKRVTTATSATISSITRVANTVLSRRQKMLERQREMKKCSPYLSPTNQERGKTASFSFLLSPHKSPRVTECIVFTKEDSKDGYQTPMRSYAGQSIGSLSSLCTVESFVSPTKEGVVGCQNRYAPFLHKTRGPCELCIFRLSEIEKEKLDAQGRHLLVQFTTGGCRDCNAFPKQIGELPLRLCRKCYANSHRKTQTRRRKKGNGSHLGYSFAKISEDMIR